jgi:hypothetical protein
VLMWNVSFPWAPRWYNANMASEELNHLRF